MAYFKSKDKDKDKDKDKNKMHINKKYLFFPILGIGVLFLILAILFRTPLKQQPKEEHARTVDTILLEKQSFAPIAFGYGQVKPKIEWKSIAEVTGKVIFKHPDLEKGKILTNGTEVLRIDPINYELKLIQAQADLASAQTSLARLFIEEQNLKQTLEIENNRLSITNKELRRKKSLRRKGVASQSDVDQQQQNTLAQQKLVIDIENKINLMPNEKSVAEALVKANQSKVAEAENLLEKTLITLPYDLRIAEVDLEENQVVNLQQTMIVAHDIETMEVEAQLSIHDIRTLVSSITKFDEQKSVLPRPDTLFSQASIKLRSGNFSVSWPAKVSRISETVDPNQATAGVILEITQDYQKLTPTSRPPLIKGMFVEASIEGHAALHWVIPERALHDDKIYLMDSNNHLRIKTINVLFRRDNNVIIDGNLREGDRIVTTDLMLAIEGMLLSEHTPQSSGEL